MKKLLLPLFILFAIITKGQENSFCTYYGQDAKYKKKEICDYLSFTGNADAEKKVDAILAQVGLKKNFVLMECINVNNAIAINLPSQFGQIRYIIYDSKFFTKINPHGKSDWGAMAILAHEIAHHLNGHTLSKSGSKPALELEADEFSGFVLSRMGATLPQALTAMQKAGNEEATATHPAKKDRIAAITKGWNSAQKLSKGKNELAKVSQEILKQKTEPNKNKNLANWLGNWRNPNSKAQLVIDTINNEIVVRKITNAKNEKLIVQFVAKNDANYLVQYQEKRPLKKAYNTLIMQAPQRDTIFYVLNNNPDKHKYFIKTIQNSTVQKTKNQKNATKSDEILSNFSIGISTGGLNIKGDVRSSSVFNQPIDPSKTIGLEISSAIRLYKDQWFLKLNYIHGSASGYNYQLGNSHLSASANNNPWTANGYSSAFYNYHTKLRSLSIMGIFSTGKRNRFSADIGAGFACLLYQTKVDALNGTSSYISDFATITANNPVPTNSNIFAIRKDIKKAIVEKLDGNFESAAERHSNRGWYNDYAFHLSPSIFIGFEYKLKSQLSIYLHEQLTFTFDDLIDGQRWQNQAASVLTGNFDNINYLGIGLRYNF